ncbi:hypothetical protein [Comamonas sp. JC664]|uniref:hypothetical protein n=1 Tax=Comamonas sp. JC664 TaxID=2801917 RepID=UPI003621DC83
MQRSLTVETQTGGEEVNADRTSDGMFFQREESPAVAALERRIAKLVNWPENHGEGCRCCTTGLAPSTSRTTTIRPDPAGHADDFEAWRPAPGTLVIY